MRTARFGEITFSNEDIVSLEHGLLGFENLKRYLLVESDEYAPVRFLQAVDDPNISFPLLAPDEIRPDYHFKMPARQREDLGVEKPEDAAVFCVVTIREGPGESTINLCAPIVINLLKRQAAQVILFGGEYRVDEPLITT